MRAGGPRPAGTSFPLGSRKASIGFATYATGIVYGLQPDALFVVVPVLALPTKAACIAHCSMFVIGTVTAMATYTLIIGEGGPGPRGVGMGMAHEHAAAAVSASARLPLPWQRSWRGGGWCRGNHVSGNRTPSMPP